jgi:hypothetical protein
MNDIHGWIATALSLPIPAYAAITSAVVGFCIPWLVEANVPMQDWSNSRFVLSVYGVAIVAGLISALTIWHSWDALVMWVPALGAQAGRDLLAQWQPRFSPRRQVILRRDASGNVIGYKEGDDQTRYFSSVNTEPKQPGSETETPK